MGQLERMHRPAGIDRVNGHDDRTDRIANFRLAVRRVTRRQVPTEPKRELSLDHRGISKIRETEAGRVLLRELAVQAPEERG